MTRARRGASLALPLICLSAALAAPAATATATDGVPNDPEFGNQWGLQDVNAPEAWDLSTGAGIKVAVVDTGVLATQEDLAGHVLAGQDFVGGSGPIDDHGTRVSGVIAATRNNGKGIVGVAPDAAIVPIRAFDGATTFDEDTIVKALAAAADSGARVVNASFGSENDLSSRDRARVRAKIDGVLAAHPDTLYVAAAGNDGNDNDADPVYPCSSEAPNLICVGAYKESGALTSTTNYGADSVDLFAPGQLIYTTSKFGYFPDSGTSMAAPFVSGEAALLFAKVPRLTPEEAIDLILASAVPLQSGSAKAASAGRPDALAALQAAVVDTDRDGVYDVVDDCPGQAYATTNGCNPPPTPTPTPVPTVMPTPTPTAGPTTHHDPVPRLRSLTTAVTRCKAHRACKRSATVKFTPDRTAKVSVRVDKRVCSKGRRCRWSRIVTTSLSVGTRGGRVVVRGVHRRSLPIGLYRVVAVPSSAAGTGRSATRQFRVR